MSSNNTPSSQPTMAGVIGYFDDPNALITATKQVRDAQYQFFDTYTPYPIHGMEEALKIKRSPIPFFTFIAGLTGICLAFTLEYWTSAVDWPLNVGGKPFNSWPAFVPVMFELTVLLAGLTTAAVMIIFNNLPNTRNRAFDPNLTNDKLALVIHAPPSREHCQDGNATECNDEDNERALKKAQKFKKFDPSEAMEFLRKAGATHVRTVMNEGWF